MVMPTVMPLLPGANGRTIKYGPAPKALVAAVRKELRRLVELPDLDENLGMIGRFANQADDMLMCVKAPEAVMKGEHEVTVPGILTSPSNAETYGASIIRQLLPALTSYQSASRDSAESLTHAIAAARRAGMTDLSAELEKKLLGKAVDGGKRPVGTGIPSVDDYLKESTPTPVPPALTEAVKAAMERVSQSKKPYSAVPRAGVGPRALKRGKKKRKSAMIHPVPAHLNGLSPKGVHT